MGSAAWPEALNSFHMQNMREISLVGKIVRDLYVYECNPFHMQNMRTDRVWIRVSEADLPSIVVRHAE